MSTFAPANDASDDDDAASAGLLANRGVIGADETGPAVADAKPHQQGNDDHSAEPAAAAAGDVSPEKARRSSDACSIQMLSPQRQPGDDEPHAQLLDAAPSPYGTPLVAPITDGQKASARERVRRFVSGTKFSIYVSHALSAWGDRMWTFAIGLFLADLLPGSLRLIAAYGFSKSGAVMLLGAVLGDWVDRRPRLFVARTSLVVQNASVVVSGTFLAIVYSLKEHVYDEPWKQSLWEAAVIITAVVSILASMAMKLAVEKDWISAMCEGDSAALADMNATLRGIDQVIFILAPVATGLVMTVSSMLSGALFIIAWNLVSVFAEYFLLYRVYKLVPALASKSQRSTRQGGQEQKELKKDVEASQSMLKEDSSRSEKHNAASEEGGCRRLCLKMFTPFITLKNGWTTYMRSELKYAGFALAFIYLTVLGFDNVFTGYVYSQGLSQLYISIALGVGACCAIAATFAYPRLRARVGVETTGLIGFSAEVTVLTLCVASVWLPGSPFSLTSHETTALPTTSAAISTSSDLWANSTALPPGGYSNSAQPFVTNHSVANWTDGEHVSALSGTVPAAAPASMISVAVLLTGAILARFGVWTADLAVNQLLLERVDKSQRGVINGVQTALNTFMSMFEFIMVIVAPAPHTFGILVIVSFVCVATGDLFFIIYCRRSRGYVLCK